MRTTRARAEQVLDYFLDHEGMPVDTFVLEKIAGRRSWRTRVSDARRLARTLRRDIVNTQLRKRIGKRIWTYSYYTMVKTSKKKAA